MDSDLVLQYCDEIDALTQKIRDEVAAGPPEPEPPDQGVVVAGGEDLQAALDVGGMITLAHGACFDDAAGYRVTVGGTRVHGEGANLVATTGKVPALDIGCDIDNTDLATFASASPYTLGIRVGRNDSAQTMLEQAPRGVILDAIRFGSHRGKRAFEINAAEVTITGCEVYDTYDPGGNDSQAIWIGNAPGPVTILGGHFEAASENVMVGGDTMKIPDCRPTGITIKHATFTKPLAWKDAGTPKVKNLLELKDGHDVLIEDCELSNSWKSAQDGYAFMFTPANGGSLRNVVVKNCRVSKVGGIVNITGTDAAGINTERTQVSILGGEYLTDPAMGGTGRFGLTTRGPEWLIVEGIYAEVHGSSFIEFGDQMYVNLFRLTGSTWNYPQYGIRIGGYNHGDNSLGIIGTIQIEGCTISGAHSSFRSRYPNNTYIGTYTGDDAE